MHKNKIIMIIISVVLSIGIVGAGLFLFREKNDSQQMLNNNSSTDEISQNDNWLTVDTVAKLEGLAKKIGVSVEYDTENIYVSDLPFAEGDASYCYKYDEDKKITGLSIGYVLVTSTEDGEEFTMEKIEAQELSNRVKTVMDWITEMLKVKVGNQVYIISSDGEILSVEEVNSYQKIIDGTAFLELRIYDTDDSVWVLNIELIGGYNIISCVFEHFPANSDEAKIPCNVTIE